MYSRCIKKQLVVKAKAKTSFKQLFTRCLALPGGYKRKTVWQLDKTPVLCVRLWEGEMAMCVWGRERGSCTSSPGQERERPQTIETAPILTGQEAPLSSSSPAPGPPSSRERASAPCTTSIPFLSHSSLPPPPFLSAWLYLPPWILVFPSSLSGSVCSVSWNNAEEAGAWIQGSSQPTPHSVNLH